MKTTTILIISVFTFCLPLFAESGNSYAASVPKIPITSGGGVMIPSSVQKDLANGKVSLNLSFILIQDIMNSCTQDVLSHPPGQRTPYVDAVNIFKDGGCKLQKCFLQGLVYDIVAQIGEAQKAQKQGNGPTDQDIQGFAVQGLTLLDSAAKNTKCGNGSNPVDPSLVALLQQLAK